MRIAIVKLSALGDVVNSMIVLQFIKKYNQSILIDWVVEENFKELLECNPHINKVEVVNFKKAKKRKSILLFLNELKKIRKLGQYDLVIDMQGLIKSAIVSKIIPSKSTIGFDRLSSREGLSAFFYSKTLNYGYENNVVYRNISLIEFALGFSVDKKEIISKTPFVFYSQKYLISNLSNTKKNVLIIPGASNAAKRYPAEKFARLVKSLDANFIIIWGNLKEKKIAENIKKISPNVNICEKLSIDSLISLIDKVDLVIGPDTGPTHIAWGMNTPSIMLFGPTPAYRNTITTRINKVIESDSKVNPFKINYKDFSIRDINDSKVIEVSRNLLFNQ